MKTFPSKQVSATLFSLGLVLLISHAPVDILTGIILGYVVGALTVELLHNS